MGVTLFWLSFASVLSVKSATFTVTTTADGGGGSLRGEIASAELNPGADTIAFNIPPTDSRHFYYRNDGIPGTVSRSMIATTTATDDAQIADIDPDWPHSWYSISTNNTRIDVTTIMTIDGYTQPGAQPNTNMIGGLNSVLRIEVISTDLVDPPSNCPNIFNTLSETHVIKGLIINRCRGGGSAGIVFDVGNHGSRASGNFIGTDPSGTIALQTGGNGLSIVTSNNVIIGGVTAADRNLISGNWRGMVISNGGVSGATIFGTLVTGNLMGTKRDGISPLPNGLNPNEPTLPLDAILITAGNGANSNSRIENNVIANSGRHGVSVTDGGVGASGNVTGHRISSNSIYSSGGVGISLGGNNVINPPTPNDPCDVDNGFNRLQNYPVLSGLSLSGNNLNISGILDSVSGGTFTIEFFSNPERDPTGFGEGRTFLGSTTVTDSDSDCISSFSTSVPRPAGPVSFITATATDADGNTSEFSASITLQRHLFDFDGDLRDDYGIFRPSNGFWSLQRSTAGFVSLQWGVATDKLTPADFDGDGKTDLAVWRPSESRFFIHNSSDASATVVDFGVSTDRPITVADWDGDGKADPSVYREGAQSFFYYRGSSNNPSGNITFVPWGTTGDIPVRGDFDGDGKNDACVFRPSNGTWYVRRSLDGSMLAAQWGLSSDKLVPADYDGDGKTDFAVFRPSDSFWYVVKSTNGQFIFARWGLDTDKLVPGDYDGDGKTDFAVWRPSDQNFYVLQSATSQVGVFRFGASDDVAVATSFVP